MSIEVGTGKIFIYSYGTFMDVRNPNLDPALVKYKTFNSTLYNSDSGRGLDSIDNDSVATVITSPPYFNLCDYKHQDQLGLEPTISAYLDRLMEVFNRVRSKLKIGGVCWIVIGDTMNNYSPIRGKGQRREDQQWHSRRALQEGYVEKECLSIPDRFVDAMRDSGWRLRQTFIWDKGTAGSIANSDTAPLTHEFVYQFVRWDTLGRMAVNCRSLPSTVLRFKPASDPLHPCPLPPGLVKTLLLASSDLNDIILDPFAGSGIVLLEALRAKRKAIGIDISQEYCKVLASKLKLLDR